MGKRRFVDLSLELKTGLGVDVSEVPPALTKLVEILAPKVKYTDHKASVPDMLSSFPGATADDLPDGLGWSEETLTVNTHAGTHFDAPYHYAPTAEGKPAKTIDEIPLEWCFNDGVVLDMRHKQAGEVITVDDIKNALSKIKYTLKEYDIVMMMTGADKQWDTLKYWTSYPGTGRDGTIWLADQGVKIVGTDAAGWDRPFQYAAEAFNKTGDKALIWEGHYAGRDREYCQMEKLTNLDKLPSHGFQVSCFPIKILKAGAGWVRPVAIIDES